MEHSVLLFVIMYMNKFNKLCPKCQNIIYFSAKNSLDNSLSKGSLCAPCRGVIILNDEDRKKLINDYNHLSCPKLSKKYNVSLSAVCSILRKSNIPLRSMSEAKRKYDVDSSFLDTIDTEEKAYFLGMLYADGYHNEHKKEIKIDLKENDKDILDKFTQLIQPTKPLRYYKGDTNIYRFIIENKRLSERLSELGCMQAKTFKIQFPLWLNESLQRHFIRGYFDGDGHLHKNVFSIVGTESFCISVSEIIERETKENGVLRIRHPERNHNIRTLQYGKQKTVLNLANWIYQNSNIYMDRKYNTYRKILESNKFIN